MTDIAQLGIAVDTSQTKLAARELDNLVQAGGRAEGATKSLGSTSKQAMAEVASAATKAQQAMQRMADSQERQERLMQQMSRQMDALTRALQDNTTANNAAAQAANNAAGAMDRHAAASQSSAKAADNAAAATGKMAGQATAASGAVGGLTGKLVAAATAALSLNKAMQDMDAWTNMNNRIRLITEGQDQFIQAQTNIIGIANSTRQPLAETAELYQRIAGSQKALGLSGGDLAKVVQTISQSMVVGGASAAGGAAALMQLGQAFNEGVLRGDEFNSVVAQAPGLMKAIADGMGKTTGEMRTLANDGKLTAEAVVKALQSQSGAVAENFAKMGSTIGQSATVFNNKMTEFIGRMDDATGISKALANAVIGLSDNMGALATGVGTLVAFGLATWLGGVATAAGGVGVAFTAAGVAAKGLLASIGPAGWLILGLGAAATAWQLMGDKAEKSGIQMDGAGSAAKAAGDKLVSGITPAIDKAIAAYDKLIAKQKEALGAAASPLVEVSKGIKEADLNLQRLAQQVVRARQGTGEYVNMGPQQRAAAEKALTDELEKASKKRAELAAKEVEYNKNVVASYVTKEDRLTEAEIKAQKRAKAQEARDKALEAAGNDRVAQEKINAAYRTEIANIEEAASKKGASAAKAAAREAAKAAKDETAAISELSDLSATYYKQLENYQKQRKDGTFTEEQYIAAVEKLIQKQPFAIAQAKEQADAWKEQEKARKDASKAVEKAYEDEVKAAEKSVEQITNKVAQLKIEEAAIALAAEQNIALSRAIELVNIKRLEEQLTIAKDASKQELVDALNAEIKARKELVDLTGNKEARDAAKKSTTEAAKEWERTAQDIEKSLTDALMRGFEGGKDAAKNMRDAVVNMFKTLVLRPIVNAVVNPVAGAVTGALGLGGGVAQAAQGGGALLGGIGNIASLAGPLGSLSAGFTMATSGIAGFTAAVEGGIAMLGSATGFSSAMAGIGQLAGALGPVALGVAALASIFKHNATPHMGAVATASGAGVSVARATEAYGGFNADMNAEVGNALSSAAKSVKDTLDAVSKLTGAATTQYEVLLSYADDTSKDAAWGNLIIKRLDDTTATALVEWSRGKEGQTPKAFADGEQGYKDFMKAVAQDTKTAIERMEGLPEWMERLLKSADTSKIDMDGFAQLMQRISEYPNALLQAAGTSRDALVQAFVEGTQKSGAEVAGQNVANMLVAGIEQSVYTTGMGQVFDIVNQGIITPMLDALITGQAVSEVLSQQAIDETIARATAAATALGTLMNSAEFQGALESIKSSLGGALGKSGSGVDYTLRHQLPVDTELTKAADEAANAAEEARKKWQDITDALLSDKAQLGIDLLRAQGKEEEAIAAERAIAIKDFDAYQIGLYDANRALEKQIATLESLNALRDESASLEIDLLRAQGNEEEALRLERERATKGMTDAEVAAYDYNRALEGQIATQESIAALQNDGALLQIELARALGKEEEAVAQERAIAIKDMSDLEIAEYDRNATLRDQIDSINELNAATKSLLSTASSLADKFLSGDTLKAFRFDLTASEINASDMYGWKVSGGELAALSIEQIQSAILDLATSGAPPALINQLLSFGGALIDLKKTAIDAEQAIADTRTGADIKLLQAQGKAQEALALRRELDTRGMNAAQIAAYDYSQSIDAQIDAINEAADVHAKITSADIRLLQAKGKEEEALIEQRKLDIIGMSAAEIAAYDYSKSLDAQIDAMNKAKETAATRAAADIRLLQAQGKEQEALVAQRALDIVGMSDAQIAAYDYSKSIDAQITAMGKAKAIADERLGLESRLLQAQGDTAGLRALELSKLDPSNRALQERIYALEDEKVAQEKLKAIADERIGLENQLHQLLGNTNALRDAELKKLDASNRPLQRSIWALEDAKSATASALEEVQKSIEQEKTAIQEVSDSRIESLNKELAIAQQRSGIEQSAMQLLGNTTALRQRELDALGGTNRALQQRIWSVEDASSGVDQALALVQRSVAAEKKRISDDAQAQIDAINAEAEARDRALSEAQKAVQDLGSLFDDIANTVKTLRGSVDQQLNISRARSFIDMSLSVARAGGAVNAERLREAMQTVTTDTAETYASGADFGFAQKRQAAILEQLGGLTGDRKDTAQAQLDAAENAVKLAQEQIDAITSARDAQLTALDAQLQKAEDAVSVMRGVDLSVASVDESIGALDRAIAQYEDARQTLAREQLDVGYSTVATLESAIEQEQANTQKLLSALDAQLTQAQEQVNAINGVNTSVLSLRGSLNGLSAALRAQADAQAGATAQVAIAGAAQSSAAAMAAIPSFDVGTNYVPHDMLAQIHEGEAIVPKEFNPAAFGGTGSDKEQLVSLVSSLTAEVKRLQGLVQEGNREQRRTANAVNGQGEAPMLVEAV